MTAVIEAPVAPATVPAAPAPASDIIEQLESFTVLSNGFVKVDTDRVRFPNGAIGNYSKVTSGAGLGVLAVPFVNYRGSAYIGLVRQYRYPIGYHTLEFPRGGSLTLGLEEAARELAEETGLQYRSATRVGTLRPDTGLLTTEVAVWKTVHQATDIRPDHIEHETGATVHWFSHGEVLGMIAGGKITCGMTLAAFALMTATNSFQCP